MPIQSQSIQRQFVVVSEEEPSSPFNGQIWVDAETGDASQFFNGEYKSIGTSKSETQNIAEEEAQKWAIVL